MPRSMMDALMQNGAPVRTITGLTTSGTGGTRTAHAHGLTDAAGNPTVPSAAYAAPTAPDADGALTAVDVRVVKSDATTVTVRASGTSVPFTLFVW